MPLTCHQGILWVISIKSLSGVNSLFRAFNQCLQGRRKNAFSGWENRNQLVTSLNLFF
jgi:hypothetical protein